MRGMRTRTMQHSTPLDIKPISNTSGGALHVEQLPQKPLCKQCHVLDIYKMLGQCCFATTIRLPDTATNVPPKPRVSLVQIMFPMVCRVGEGCRDSVWCTQNNKSSSIGICDVSRSHNGLFIKPTGYVCSTPSSCATTRPTIYGATTR